MDCLICHSPDAFREEVIRYCDETGPEPFFVENVPAFVCLYCGDKAIPEAALAIIKGFRAGAGQPIGQQTIPVYDYARLDEPVS